MSYARIAVMRRSTSWSSDATIVVAQTVGYDNLDYFARFLREKVCMRPRAFCKNIVTED